jgi:hypothetical protein
MRALAISQKESRDARGIAYPAYLKVFQCKKTLLQRRAPAQA